MPITKLFEKSLAEESKLFYLKYKMSSERKYADIRKVSSLV